MIGLIQLGLLAWLLFLAGISMVLAAIYPAMRGMLRRVTPADRAILLRALSVAPLVGGGVASFLCFAPKLAASALARVDHCTDHADGHFHFCLNHPPQVLGGIELWISFAAVGIAVLLVSILRWRRLWNSRRTLRQLAMTTRYDDRHDAWVAETDLPIAISVGVLEKRTILSSGLLRLIPPLLIEVIVAHEQAHGRRGDGFWKIVIWMLSLGQLPGTREILERDLELACEQACDEYAGEMIGDRVRVAQALVAMERVRHDMSMFGPAALAFGTNGLSARVASLLSASAGSSWSRRAKLGLLLVSCGIAAWLADPMHHLTETILHYVLG
jgi:Zn-dependent protease with chaperone function